MNSERSTLSESIRELSAELHKKTRELGEQEIAVTRRMDDIDSLVGKYMHGKAVIGLNASSVQQQFDIDFNVDVNMASSDLTAVNVVGQRIKESIRPGLQTFGEQLRTEWRQHSNQKIEWDDKLDRLGSELEQRRHQVQALELKLASLESAAEAEKQVRHMSARFGECPRSFTVPCTSQSVEIIGADSGYTATFGQARGGCRRHVHVERPRAARRRYRDTTAQLRVRSLAARLIIAAGIHTEDLSFFFVHAQTSRDDPSWQRDEGKDSARDHVPARTDHPGQAIRHRQVERAHKVCSTTRLASALRLSCPVAFFTLSLSLELVNLVFLVRIEVFNSHLPLACTQNNHIIKVPFRTPWSCLADCIGFYTIHEGHIDTSSTAAFGRVRLMQRALKIKVIQLTASGVRNRPK